MVEWNGGMEWWTGMVEWNGGSIDFTELAAKMPHPDISGKSENFGEFPQKVKVIGRSCIQNFTLKNCISRSTRTQIGIRSKSYSVAAPGDFVQAVSCTKKLGLFSYPKILMWHGQGGGGGGG